MPPYSEDEVPCFLDKWLEVNESILVIGCLCVSMLSASLHLYFKTWEKRLAVPVDESLKPIFSKSGWLKRYVAYFSRHFGVEFNEMPVDLEKLHQPFFIDESERSLLLGMDAQERAWLMPPTFTVTPEKFYKAIAEVQRFTEWLEGEEANASNI